jgi:hypothetical protein
MAEFNFKLKNRKNLIFGLETGRYTTDAIPWGVRVMIPPEAVSSVSILSQLS